MKGVAASLADHVSTSSTLYLCEPACRLSIGVLHMKGCGIMGLVETRFIRAFAPSYLKPYTINPKSALRVPCLDN